jgi:hypothetical protein
MLATMNHEGWNHAPQGFRATFDTDAAPWWLRAVVSTPFIDRFGYPVVVRRGLRYRTPHPDVVADPLVKADAIRAGWNIESH